MIEKKRRILIPQYMKKFSCIGSACEDSCCIGWRVDIDHETYKKYQKVRDDALTPLMDQYIKRNRTEGHGEANHAKIKLLSDTSCPFLNEKTLCKIQLRFGEDYLSDVCTTYPRIVHSINGLMERSATVSCPEAARLVLLNPEPMEFDEDEESRDVRNVIKKTIKAEDLNLNNKPQKYLWEIRIFTITLLQNREYTLNERLIILGMFFQALQQMVSSGKNTEISGLIATYTVIIEEGSLRESLEAIPVQYNIQMELLKEIADKRYFMGVTSSRYLECFSEFLTGIQYTAESKVEEIGLRYQNAAKDYYEPFMNEHDYILENYLVNYVFKNLFPFTSDKSLFDAYMMLIIHYALIKMHLIGMAGFHEGLTEDLVVKLIQSFAKTVEHNQKYLDGIADQMRQNNFNTMAYMAILIKN